ncbi:MAG: hypothetical protein O7G30_07195, partial [Proteobacteria bacterium]|nr:hypothetical protein [Pseudomonadota bacterium]
MASDTGHLGQHDRGRRPRRGWIFASLTLCALLVTSLVGATGPIRARVDAYLEPVRSEFGSLVALAMRATTDPLPDYELRIEPRVYRAAGLLGPRARDNEVVDDSERWWFPGVFRSNGRELAVELQIAGDPDVGHLEERVWRIRFPNRLGFNGLREIELLPTREREFAFESAARHSARSLDLLTPPSGFAGLSVNGVDVGTYFWSELGSPALLERLGYADGPILWPVTGTDSHVDRLGTPANSEIARARLAALFVLTRDADDLRFEQELPGLLNVRKFLTWNALASVLSAQAPATRLPWYFDPVTGLLEPVAAGFAEVFASEAGSEAAYRGLAARVLDIPRYRAARDRILAALVRESRFDVASSVQRKLGEILPRLASRLELGLGSVPHPSHLRELALFQREVRGTLQATAEALRGEIELASESDPGRPPLRFASEMRAARWVRKSGLPFQRSGDELRLRQGTYHVTRSLVVPAEYRLTLDPGVTLVMEPGVSLVTFRGLSAEGTPTRPIRVTPSDPRRPWGALGVVRAPEPSRLAHITISGGSSDVVDGIQLAGQLSFNASDVTLRDSEIRDARGGAAMSVVRAHFEVLRSRFTNNASDALALSWTEGEIHASLFAENGDDGLDLASSRVSVLATTFYGTVDKAISAGARSRLHVEDSRLVDSGIAIASKDGSRVDVVGSEFRRNELVLALYRNKPLFGGGFARLTGGLLVGNTRDFHVESGSDLQLDGVVREESGASRALHAVRTPVQRPHA